MPADNYDAFISFNNRDLKVVKKIKSSIESIGLPWYSRKWKSDIELFIYTDQQEVGKELDQKIKNALRKSKRFLLMASPNIVTSIPVQKEIKFWNELYEEEKYLPKFMLVKLSGQIMWAEDENKLKFPETTALPNLSELRINKEVIYSDLSTIIFNKQLEDNDEEYLKVIAGIKEFLLEGKKSQKEIFDTQKVEERKQIRVYVIAVVFFILLVLGLIWLIVQNRYKDQQQQTSSKEIKNQLLLDYCDTARDQFKANELYTANDYIFRADSLRKEIGKDKISPEANSFIDSCQKILKLYQ